MRVEITPLIMEGVLPPLLPKDVTPINDGDIAGIA